MYEPLPYYKSQNLCYNTPQQFFQCMTHKNYIKPGDLCFTNPIYCDTGLSMSVFYQVVDPTDSGKPGVKEYIVSTGSELSFLLK